jgi:hypothetical protein
MSKIVIDMSSLELIEGTEFPEACKFCLREDCTGCPFHEKRLALQAELLLEEEPTIEKFELQQFTYSNKRKE